MKTVITSQGNTSDARFDRRFGRASWLCIYNEETKETSFISNDKSNSGHGAGTTTAERIRELGAGRVISGDFGEKAQEMLHNMQIQMVIPSDIFVKLKDLIKQLSV